MATAPPSHTAFQFFRPAKRRLTCECLNRHRSPLRPAPSSRRNVSSATPHFSEMEVEGKPRPRWSYTPPAMAAPVRSRLKPEGVTPLKINSDPQKLDQVYIRFLGKDGDKMLKEETKWLAVTHKSFDHGRRGFNDRLAFIGTLDFLLLYPTDPSNKSRDAGKRIVDLQTTLGLLTASTSSKYLKDTKDSFGRQPFQHPALEGIECLSGGARDFFTHHKQLSTLAQQYGLQDVVRCVPKKVR
jgi:large subunit ribosomal protein L15